MKLLDFPIIRLTICLVVGIGICNFLTIPMAISIYVSLGLLGLLGLVYLISKNQFKKTIWFGLLAYITTISIGVLTVNFHNQKNFKNHYSNLYDINKGDDASITLRISEVLKPNTFNNRYVANLIKIDSNEVVGKILLNVSKDSLKNTFQIDDRLVIKTHLQELYKPLNPHQFNYKNYLENHYIYAQIYSDYPSVFVLSKEKHTLFGYADNIRLVINEKLEKYPFKPDELAVINALLLGQRQGISKDLYQDYANAGAIHILAISGLHIGIILLLLNFLLNPITHIKHGFLIKTIILLILLWSYAVIAGLSPSVMRAVTMFSAIAIGMNLNRPNNIYNTLAISAFIILLFKPLFLFEVGFQLSYFAVIGIVSIQPMLYRSIKIKYWLPNKIWELFTVSIAAQLGIFPLGIFYFHQFPGLFFISNIIIIPFLGFILSCGAIVIFLALVNILPDFVASLYGSLIHWMNTFFRLIAKQESFIFNDISINWLFVIAIYLVIISFTRYFMFKNYRRLILGLIAILIFQNVLVFNEKNIKLNNEFVVFHKSRFSIIGQKRGTELQLFHNLDSLTKTKDYILKNYRIGNFITETHQSDLQNTYNINDETLLIIDSLGVYQIKSFKPEYILLSGSPKINLNRVIDSLHPKQIIADGSNYKSYIKRWEATCIKRKIPFHQTSKKGAFIFNTN